MHTNKEAKKPHVLLIVQMDFGENMRVFLSTNGQFSFMPSKSQVLVHQKWGEIPLASEGSNLEG